MEKGWKKNLVLTMSCVLQLTRLAYVSLWIIGQNLGFTAKPKVKTKLLNKRLAFIVKKVAAQNKIPYKKLQNAVYRVTKEGKGSSSIKLDPSLSESVDEVLKRYKNGKLARNWVDFADMLNLPTQLLKDNPDIMKKIGANISHLLVDEVQDFSEKECQLIYYLAKYAKSAVLVGDTKADHLWV